MIEFHRYKNIVESKKLFRTYFKTKTHKISLIKQKKAK